MYLLPEDDAIRSIAVGFADKTSRRVEVLNPASGWSRAKELMVNTYASRLKTYSAGHLVLLIDFDDDFQKRLALFKQAMPAEVAKRIYVLGPLREAETLKQDTKKKFSQIGQELANECEHGQYELWNHAQMRHNQPEVQRLHSAVKGFLF